MGFSVVTRVYHGSGDAVSILYVRLPARYNDIRPLAGLAILYIPPIGTAWIKRMGRRGEVVMVGLKVSAEKAVQSHVVLRLVGEEYRKVYRDREKRVLFALLADARGIQPWTREAVVVETMDDMIKKGEVVPA